MRVSQYVYFALKSTRVPATEISARLGIEADESKVRGSRLARPPRPVAHTWRIVCRRPGLTVDEQIAQVVDRLFEHAERIGALALELDGAGEGWPAATLQVVRMFEHPDGEEEDRPAPVGGLEKLPGQHQLLGWHLDGRVLEFLRLTRAELDIDEYAYG
ncbi:DUF4279 domain-containing protein [Actinomadura madurae]|uniref:DUF4279 domain-containing protein n=1 Tax=Actinomadura madurae TaxID=1993 RepID=UPI00202639C6|nr:DUF4279 domain-containing protein [Actinomadura madurae]MCP9948405.1 DUF4279 domain-containing protein [Actinomadura madurae]MCP9965176.1 DUF4279 domain-containing protein [Actinomadura madurae]MCQ0010836.1 DUF4279 domain-containing protein [Actinomadura madurae]MCQ0013856.1 DUF4279 domain-containing protein [Actinomadura madurae]URM94052.1 DUF4279 domain-containing protein [Actinomadura madurae]